MFRNQIYVAMLWSALEGRISCIVFIIGHILFHNKCFAFRIVCYIYSDKTWLNWV